ncbi:MAG TPA: hypothetical protein VFA18_13475 [Gemmataceae bacterium]|nr:hypothetical protein [Gemmataceae bacterium]
MKTALRLLARLSVCLFLPLPAARASEPVAKQHYLYVGVPGIRDDTRLGGAGIVVFDIDHGHRFVRRIPTPASLQPKPENIKGICASAATGRLYFTTLHRLYCLDLRTDQPLWDTALPGGCDRLSITPDGKVLYVPSLEGPHWNVVDALTGHLIEKIETKSGAHNTVVSLDGSKVYLAGLRSPLLRVFDRHSNRIIRLVGPFSGVIRPFTVNGSDTRCYVTVNGLLGFEVGDLQTGKVLARVAVEGVPHGPTARHGCPSHGVGLTPDEREVWVCDGHNSMIHAFDITTTPARKVASIRLRDQPGWVTFSIDGRYAYPSTGEVVDTATKKIIAALTDEKGRPVHSEKMVEIDFRKGVPVQVGDQFGVGRKAATHARNAAPASAPSR